MIFFIILFSLLLAPFQCEQHPNGRWTVRRYGDVYCNGKGQQWLMFMTGAFASLFPIGFLAACALAHRKASDLSAEARGW